MGKLLSRASKRLSVLLVFVIRNTNGIAFTWNCARKQFWSIKRHVFPTTLATTFLAGFSNASFRHHFHRHVTVTSTIPNSSYYWRKIGTDGSTGQNVSSLEEEALLLSHSLFHTHIRIFSLSLLYTYLYVYIYIFYILLILAHFFSHSLSQSSSFWHTHSAVHPYAHTHSSAWKHTNLHISRYMVSIR